MKEFTVTNINASGVETAQKHVNHNFGRGGVEEFIPQKRHKTPAIIVAGGPSLADTLPILKKQKGTRFFINTTEKQLRDAGELEGTEKDYVFTSESRPGLADVMPTDGDCTYMLASMTTPKYFQKLNAANKRVVMYHALEQGIRYPENTFLVNGGSTSTLRAIYAAFWLGHPEIHLFGFDCSNRPGKTHAYTHVNQKAYDEQETIRIKRGETIYETTPAHVGSVQDFMWILSEDLGRFIDFHVYGDGLLQDMVRFNGKVVV